MGRGDITAYLYIRLFMRNASGVKSAEANLARSGRENLRAACLIITGIPNLMITIYRALACKLGQLSINLLKDSKSNLSPTKNKYYS